MSDLENDLNAISDSVLGEDSAAFLNPQTVISEVSDTVQAKVSEQSGLRKTIKELRILVLNLPIEQQPIAWRCTHVFHHQNERVCNTLNAFQVRNKRVRILCEKCQQRRANPKTILQEYLEFEKESLRENLIKAGVNEDSVDEQIELIIKGEV